jgi:hypothetical protein
MTTAQTVGAVSIEADEWFAIKWPAVNRIILTHLAARLSLPVFACQLPRPTLVADYSVTRLSPRFR